ncbi:MAG: anthranilate synthase component I family protein [Chitinophagales bacterium]|nr:anthranilate synthase component I family protein [Chitinophagales bacterium]
MRTFYSLDIANIDLFKEKLLQISKQFSDVCILESNNYPHYPYTHFGNFIALDSLQVFSCKNKGLDDLQQFINQTNDWLFGYIAYDVKNEIEPILSSTNFDGISADNINFFQPKYLISIEKDKVLCGVISEYHYEEFIALINQNIYNDDTIATNKIVLQSKVDKQLYINTINTIKKEIQIGNIYEMNYCMEWFADYININPENIFKQLNQISQAPFTAYYKSKEIYMLCASPERFLKKHNDILITQPIKGTRKRSKDLNEDEQLKQELEQHSKERAENIMIVDLVRNDLSKIANKSTVTVEELCKIYSFEQVHQMISTVTAEVDNSVSFTEIIKAMFPMGSMTGAPKIAAMQIIEQLEKTKRGIYSGTIGYITPKGNFDFNVVIRGIIYNSKNKYLSIQTGSAITIDSIAENEYEECLLKAKAMMSALTE